MKNLLIFTVLITSSVHAQSFMDFDFGESDTYSDSSLGSACKQNGFSCGECETTLQNDLNSLMAKITGNKFKTQDHWGDGKDKTPNSSHVPMAPGVTLDATLQDIISIFRKNNPVGDNKLNFVVIGESESLQGSSIKNGKIYPRIMLKSPNSELMVTFNTDPEAKGYNTIEMMRWNGKEGRYEFQELNFGEKGEKPHVDASGSKCIECHKESPRPNWDTYRAWAGVVPSRDDMMEMHGEDETFIHSKGLQPDAKAYINFLDQIVADKEKGSKSRIAMLDIPFDEKNQLRDYVEAAGGKKLSPREQVDLIKKKISETGFYRIKHFPDKDEASQSNAKMSFNFDGKTAQWAGPSQFAFDQMLAQNMCKVTTDLKKHPEFDKFKYGLALLMACGKEGDMESVYPDEFKKKILDYYHDTKYASLQDLPEKDKPKGRAADFDAINTLLRMDTSASHDAANGFKFNRHGKFLNSYLTNVEKTPSEEAAKLAKYYSEKVSTPTQNGFHAIGDEGGVKGVGEDSTGIMSDARMLLEPFGVKVGHWSLVHGKSNAYNSFSFSDQFSLFRTQPIWNELKKEAGSCGELEVKAKAALSAPSRALAQVSPESDNTSEIDILCGQKGQGVQSPLDMDKVNEVGFIAMEEMKPDLKKDLGKCLNCHDTDGDIEFPGFRKFVKNEDEKEFTDFLNSKSEYFNRPVIEVMQIKLGVLPRPFGGLDYGEAMPPSNWKDNPEYAAKHGISPLRAQSFRRNRLGLYLTFTAAGGNKEKIKAFCDKINNNSEIKEINGDSSDERSSGARAQ